MIITLNENGNSRQLNLIMFGKEIISFGRHPECDIVIDAEYVSRIHGCFFYENGQWCVQDMESSFGIHLNNQKIAKNILSVGDTIRIFSPGKEHTCVQITVNAIDEPVANSYSTDFQTVNTVMYSENYAEHITPEYAPVNPASSVIQGYAPDIAGETPWKLESKGSDNKLQKTKKPKTLIIGISVAAAVLLIVGIAWVIMSGSDKKSNDNDDTEVVEKTTEQVAEEKTTEKLTTEATTEEVILPDVEYRTYVQTYGWKDWGKNGETSGTVGESKRLEAIDIKLSDTEYKGDIEYITYVQGIGWQGGLGDDASWCKNGETSGTTDQSKRVEAICIRLTGELEKKFDVYYRVHAQSYGWMSWSCNGDPAGTVNYSKSVESIQIVLVEKGEAAPANDFGGVTTAYEEPYAERTITEEEQAYYQYLSNIEANATGRVDGGVYVDQGEYSWRNYYWSYVIDDFDSNGKKELLIKSENRGVNSDGIDSPFTQSYMFYEYDPSTGTVIELNGVSKYEVSDVFTCYNNGTIRIGEEFFMIIGMRTTYLYDIGVMNEKVDPDGEYKNCDFPINYSVDGNIMQINGLPGSDFYLMREVTPSEGEQIFSFINPDNEIPVTEYDFTRENIEKIIGN